MKIKYKKSNGQIICMGAFKELDSDGITTGVIDFDGDIPGNIEHYKVVNDLLVEKNKAEKDLIETDKLNSDLSEKQAKKDLLKKLGLTKPEIKVLRALLRDGIDE